MYINSGNYTTNLIPVYNAAGQQIEEITLPEAIRPSRQRRGGFSASGTYYKGAGIIYSGHLANYAEEGLIQTGQTSLPYQRYHVLNPFLYGKFGIFSFPHQPVFSDFEGGCGPKEENLLPMQKQFYFSAIEGDIEILSTPFSDHKIYAYHLKMLSGSYTDTLHLLEYILTENFNCAWDKNVWADIYCYGYVRDLADWFVSEERCHKLGTVYAFLNSILYADKYLYLYIIESLTGLEYLEPIFLPYIAALIVRHFCPDCMEVYDLDAFCPALYADLLDDLYSGKACCHLENGELWGSIRKYYRKLIPGKVRTMETALVSLCT